MPSHPSQPDRLGERISSLEATVDGFERYERDRWHKLDNDLQLLIGMPVAMARDIAKLEGKLEAKIDGRLAAIETRLFAIETQRQQLTGAKQLGVWLIQTILAGLAVLFAFKAGGVR
jgi:hypothetical protein